MALNLINAAWDSDLLFGTTPRADEHTQAALSPEQQRILNQLLSAFGSAATGAAPLTSPDYTKLSPLENTSLAGLEQMAMNFATPSEATKTSQGALTNIIDTADKGFEDYYRTNIAEPITRTFNESILPGINRQYSNDFFSTDRASNLDRSQQRVLEALVQGAGTAKKDYRTQTIDASKALFGGEVSAAQAKGLDIQSLIAALTGGGTERNIKVSERNMQLEALLKALGIKTQDNTVVGIPGTTGLVQSFIGGFGEGLGGAVGAGAGGCWVAEELYGANADQTHRIREFCSAHLYDISVLGRFIRAYFVYGRSWAAAISNNIQLRALLKPVWDNLYIQARKETLWLTY